jgi:succinate dehydrogenase / fumarate reductase, iron-sulfur subunit
MADHGMTLNLKVWRQEGPSAPGKLVPYTLEGVNPHMSFLEMIDLLNERLIAAGEMPVEFDNDCREGICGSCSMVIDGEAHGPWKGTAVCQLHMRQYRDGDTVVVEPWRATAFPVIRDLVVDRSALDRIIGAGGYVSVNTGNAPDANSLPIAKVHADEAMDYAACIGCGACVAACPNGSAALFTAAKISQLALLPQGEPEARHRVVRMVDQMEQEGFGDCSNHGECEAVCPKEISINSIARMRREYIKAIVS